MPCAFCGARQDDPVRGASPWRRGVRAGTQVLICPDCQSRLDWDAELDRCPGCGSATLVRSLGETRCRSCGWAGTDGGSAAGPPPPPGGAAGLAADVDAAIERLFRRTTDG